MTEVVSHCDLGAVCYTGVVTAKADHYKEEKLNSRRVVVSRCWLEIPLPFDYGL